MLSIVKYIKKKEYKKLNKKILSNPNIYPKIGLVLDLDFHLSNKWTVVLTPYRINAIINELNCVIIENQQDYDKYKSKLDVVISEAPGWSAPYLNYEIGKPFLKYLVLGDPHYESEKKQRYFIDNEFSYILAYYYNPFLYYFKFVQKEKILYFPWSVPDELINRNKIEIHNQDYLLIFGTTAHECYETRNWCKGFDFVRSTDYSGVERKGLVGKKYFEWLRQQDAVISAHSLAPQWRHVVAKYFEIPASGCLLFAQEAEDLELLGFEDNKNCITFNKENFEKKARTYLSNKKAYIPIREAGRDLILEQHTLSKRINWLKKHISDSLK